MDDQNADYYQSFYDQLSALEIDLNVTLNPLLINEFTTKRLPLNPCISLDMVRPHVDLDTYEKFAYRVNGIVTTFFVAFGLFGNLLLFSQVEKRRILKHRLGAHLKMLCVWDTLLLVTSLASSSVMALLYGTMRYYGIAAYLLYICNPLGNFSVTGTLWQIVSITIERYLAVSRPLSERIKNAAVSVKAICLLIILLSVLLNFPTFIMEHKIESCLIMSIPVPSNNSALQIVKTEIAKNTEAYKLLCHFIPDLIFRCPFPFVLVLVLTARTLQLVGRASIVRTTIRRDSQRVTAILTLLIVKFLICNSLFMVNTAMEMVKVDHKRYWDFFLAALYMTDVSNFLLVLHSATNWMLFYEWPFKMKKKTSSKAQTALLDAEELTLLNEMWSNIPSGQIGAGLLSTMSNKSENLANFLIDYKNKNSQNGSALNGDSSLSVVPCDFAEKADIAEMGSVIQNFIGKIISELTLNTGYVAGSTISAQLRKVGSVHQAKEVTITTPDWIVAKTYLKNQLLERSNLTSNIKAESAVDAFVSFVLYEIKSGYLCESVRRNNDRYLFTMSHKSSESASLMGSWKMGSSCSNERPSIPKRSSDPELRPLLSLENECPLVAKSNENVTSDGCEDNRIIALVTTV